MKSVGVTDELASLFYNQEFVLALSQTNDSRFIHEKDDLFEYWLAWLEETGNQLTVWLTLASATMLTTTTLSITLLNNRKIKMSVAEYLELAKEYGITIYPILCGCPFVTTFRSTQSENYINNLLGWAASRQSATCETGGENFMLFRELQPEVVELTTRLLQLADLTHNRIQIAAKFWGLGHLSVTSFL